MTTQVRPPRTEAAQPARSLAELIEHGPFERYLRETLSWPLVARFLIDTTTRPTRSEPLSSTTGTSATVRSSHRLRMRCSRR